MRHSLLLCTCVRKWICVTTACVYVGWTIKYIVCQVKRIPCDIFEQNAHFPLIHSKWSGGKRIPSVLIASSGYECKWPYDTNAYWNQSFKVNNHDERKLREKLEKLIYARNVWSLNETPLVEANRLNGKFQNLQWLNLSFSRRFSFLHRECELSSEWKQIL